MLFGEIIAIKYSVGEMPCNHINSDGIYVVQVPLRYTELLALVVVGKGNGRSFRWL
jgi:hypothetical protein